MQLAQADLTKARFFLTHSGYVALECDTLDGSDQLKFFGPHGVLPPRRFSEMVDEMIRTLAAASDDEDAAGLKSLADDLTASLGKVEAASAKLEKL